MNSSLESDIILQKHKLVHINIEKALHLFRMFNMLCTGVFVCMCVYLLDTLERTQTDYY